jgi:Glyoxalase-like domain
MIDHLVYGAPELGTAMNDLERRFGVRAAAGGRHVGIGTYNALLAPGRAPSWR